MHKLPQFIHYSINNGFYNNSLVEIFLNNNFYNNLEIPIG